MGFNIQHSAKVAHINIRTQGNDSNQVNAYDIKFALEGVTPEVLRPVLGISEEYNSGMLWAPELDDPDQNPIMLGITNITLSAEYDQDHAISIGGVMSEIPCAVKKFSFTPRGQYVADLVFQVSLVDPPKAFTDAIIDALHEEIRIAIKSTGDLFDGGADGE